MEPKRAQLYQPKHAKPKTTGKTSRNKLMTFRDRSVFDLKIQKAVSAARTPTGINRNNLVPIARAKKIPASKSLHPAGDLLPRDVRIKRSPPIKKNCHKFIPARF